MITTTATTMSMSTPTERIRDFQFSNLSGLQAVEIAYEILNSAVGAYPRLDDISAIQLEALADVRDTFYLYFLVYPVAARDVVREHQQKFCGVRGVLWPVLGYLFGNALYRWKYRAARRALNEAEIGLPDGGG